MQQKLIEAFLDFLSPNHLVIGTKNIADKNIWNYTKDQLDNPSNWRFAPSVFGSRGIEYVIEFIPEPQIYIRTTNWGYTDRYGHDITINGQDHRPHAYMRNAWKNFKLPNPVTTEDCRDVIKRIDTRAPDSNGNIPDIFIYNMKRKKRLKNNGQILRTFDVDIHSYCKNKNNLNSRKELVCEFRIWENGHVTKIEADIEGITYCWV